MQLLCNLPSLQNKPTCITTHLLQANNTHLWNNYSSAQQTGAWNTFWKNDFRGNFPWTPWRARVLTQTGIPFLSAHKCKYRQKLFWKHRLPTHPPVPTTLLLLTVVLVERIVWVILNPHKTKAWKRPEPMQVTWLLDWVHTWFFRTDLMQ